VAGGELRLTLENVDGPGQHLDTRSLPAEAYVRARAAAREVLYAQRLTADRREPETGAAPTSVVGEARGARLEPLDLAREFEDAVHLDLGGEGGG